jgi:hypothetical protein
MYTASERIQMNREAGTCTEGATVLSSSSTHSNSFSCHPSFDSTSSEAASNKSVVSGKTIGAESESSAFSTVGSSQSDRKAGLSSQVHNNGKQKDASKAINTTIQDLEEVMPQWVRFLLCWGESSTPNSDSDTMTNKDLLLQDLLQVEYDYNLQQSKHQGMLQSYSSHSINTKANTTSNSFPEALVGVPDDRSDISTERSTRSFVEGSSLTKSSRQYSSNGSSDYPKAAYENFLGRKTNRTIISSDTTSSKTDNSSSSHNLKARYGSSLTKSSRQYSSNGSSDYPKAAYENFLGRKTNRTIISSDTTSSKTDNSSSSHNLKASYGLSSLSTQSSELDSSMITAAPLQYSSTTCSSSEVMPDRGLKANTTNISSAHSASATDNSSKSTYGSLISSTSRSIADSSFATSSQKHSSLSSSSFGKSPLSYHGLKTFSDTTETSNLSTYRGATLSSITTSSGITALPLFSKISKASKKCSRKIVRCFDSKGKPPLPPRSHSENHATEVSLEQLAKYESMVMENNNASLQLMEKPQYEGLKRSNASLHVTTSREPTSFLIPRKTADNASISSSHFTLPEAVKPCISVVSRNTVDASTLSSHLASPGVSKATFTSMVASKSDVSKDSTVERGIVSLSSRNTALKAGNSVETRQTVDASTLSLLITTLGVSKTNSTSIAASETGVSKDPVVEGETLVSRKPTDHSLTLLLQVPEPSLALISVSTHLGEEDENVVSSKSFTQRLKSMDILSDEATLSSSKLREAEKHPSLVASKEEIISKQPANSEDVAASP